VKTFAAKHGLKYNEALKDPRCKATYKKDGAGLAQDAKKAVKSAASKMGLGLAEDAKRAVKSASKKIGFGVIDETDEQMRIAHMYNSRQLGDNSSKKYVSL